MYIIYTYKQIHQGPQNWTPKWVPESPGPEGTPIEKTLEFVIPERTKLGCAGPLFEQISKGWFWDAFSGVLGPVRGVILGPVGGDSFGSRLELS